MICNLPLCHMKKPLHELNHIDGETLLIDKPYGWSSFAVVAQLKKWTKAKIGHAGTLDPLATGLVICCTGKSTKKLTALLGLKKEYTGIIHLGATTPTYDLESEPSAQQNIDHITRSFLEEKIALFTGDILQKPPVHAAIKQDGKPIYLAARKGEQVEVQAKPKTVYVFEITSINLPEFEFRIACSSGTYIRSLAHDLGEEMGCGAYLKSLRRTQIGDFRIEDSYTIEELSAHFGSQMNARIIKPWNERNLVQES